MPRELLHRELVYIKSSSSRTSSYADVSMSLKALAAPSLGLFEACGMSASKIVHGSCVIGHVMERTRARRRFTVPVPLPQ